MRWPKTIRQQILYRRLHYTTLPIRHTFTVWFRSPIGWWLRLGVICGHQEDGHLRTAEFPNDLAAQPARCDGSVEVAGV